jgi:short-subunit dehydrogenase
MIRQLRNQVVLLTGASRGIGRCVAQILAEKGARLALVARSAEKLGSVVETIHTKGAEAVPIVADLSIAEDRQRVVNKVIEHYGTLNVLINNAGVASYGRFETSSEEILRQMMEINFFAPAELIRLCIPHLVKAASDLRDNKQPERSAIVNVASICGRRGIPFFPEHSSSKSALVGLNEALRGELTHRGVDVILLIPGTTRPDDLEQHLLRNEGGMGVDYSKGLDPMKVASGLVYALEKSRRETVIGKLATWIRRGNRMTPRILEWFVNRRVRKQKKLSAPQGGEETKETPHAPVGV